MSRKVPFYVPLCVSAFLCAISLNMDHVGGSQSDHCSSLLEFDVDEIEEHLLKLSLADVPTVKMMIAGFKCPASTLPFGALKSDWARLLLLREAQPDGSIVKRKLERLMRILIIAYYQMEERLDTSTFDAEISERAAVNETTTAAPAARKPNGSSGGHFRTNETSSDSYQPSHVHSLPIVTLITNYDSRKNSSAKLNVATRAAASSPTETSGVASNSDAAVETLGNCLKNPLLSVTHDNPARAYAIFEPLSSRKRDDERTVAQRRDGIGVQIMGSGAAPKISPPANDFWRYLAFSTAAPLTVSAIARPYRTWGLNGFETNPGEVMGTHRAERRSRESRDVGFTTLTKVKRA